MAPKGGFTNQDVLMHSQANVIIDLLFYMILPVKGYNCWGVDQTWLGLKMKMKSDSWSGYT